MKKRNVFNLLGVWVLIVLSLASCNTSSADCLKEIDASDFSLSIEITKSIFTAEEERNLSL